MLDSIDKNFDQEKDIRNFSLTEVNYFRNLVLDLSKEQIPARFNNQLASEFIASAEVNHFQNEEQISACFNNLVANEFIARSVDALTSPSMFILATFNLPETYIEPAKQILLNCFQVFCKQHNIPLPPVVNHPNDLIKTLGTEQYKKFVSRLQESFISISHQLLSHLEKQGLIQNQLVSAGS